MPPCLERSLIAEDRYRFGALLWRGRHSACRIGQTVSFADNATPPLIGVIDYQRSGELCSHTAKQIMETRMTSPQSLTPQQERHASGGILALACPRYALKRPAARRSSWVRAGRRPRMGDSSRSCQKFAIMQSRSLWPKRRLHIDPARTTRL